MKQIKVTLFFPPSSITTPITHVLIKNYDLELNILHADIRPNKTGKLIMDMKGKKSKVDEAIEYLKKSNIDVRIYESRITIDKDKCVNCGACTAVCPSNALTIGADDWELKYNQEDCLVCGLCVKTCPTKAITMFE